MVTPVNVPITGPVVPHRTPKTQTWMLARAPMTMGGVVRADHRAEPHGRTLAEPHVADQFGRRGNPGRRWNLRLDATDPVKGDGSFLGIVLFLAPAQACPIIVASRRSFFLAHSQGSSAGPRYRELIAPFAACVTLTGSNHRIVGDGRAVTGRAR